MKLIHKYASSFTALALLCAAPAYAQKNADEYPTRAVNLIVPFPAGGTTDVVARLVTARVGELWGKTIVVENQGGASGMIGTKNGAAAKPDGYTLTLGNNQTHATNATLFANPPLDLRKDVTPIAMLTRTKHALVVPSNAPYQTLQELLEAGKTKHLNYATSSVGSSSHLVSESLSNDHGLKTTAVPYRGAAPAVNDTIAGHVDFMIASYGSAAAYLASGQLRALAISGEERDPKLPDVPTFQELGLHSLSVDSWVALYAPAGTPEPILRTWSDALAEVMKDPKINDQLIASGFEVWFKPLEEMITFNPQEIERWAALVRQVGVQLD